MRDDDPPPSGSASTRNGASDARLVDLELKYMVLQKTLDDLGDVVARQQRELDRAAEALRRLEGRLRDVGDDIPDERPPHY